MAKFISLEEAKVYCRIFDESKYDDLLSTLIESYTASIQQWLGRDIISTAYTEYHDIVNKQVSIFLKQFPIISIAGATSNSVAVVENTDYYAYHDTGILKKREQDGIDVLNYIKDFWYEGNKKFEITYTAGYATIPEPIKLATKKLVKRDFNDSGVDDVQHRHTGSEVTIRYDLQDGMPPGVYSLLNPYRRQFG